MRRIGKARRRPPAGRPRDRDGGFPRHSGGVARASRCPASPRHALLAENLGKPSLGVNIMDLWYEWMGWERTTARWARAMDRYSRWCAARPGKVLLFFSLIHTKVP